MDLGLKNKVIIVTGAAMGVGEGIVQVLLEEGANVAIVGRTREGHLKMQNEIETYGGDLFLVEAESGEPANCKKAVDAIVQKYGRIEGLVNNADVSDHFVLGTENHERFSGTLHTNLAEYYLLTHFALPYLKISRGAIVNIGSKTAETGQANSSSYAAVNGGRNALTREWAVELLKYSIRVNAVLISEAYMQQHESRIRALKNPNGIAHTVAFLLSEKSSHTTGQLIHVEGGFTPMDSTPGNA